MKDESDEWLEGSIESIHFWSPRLTTRLLGITDEIMEAIEEPARRASATELSREEMIIYLVSKGWTIWGASCRCGGAYIWMKPRPSGAYETAGCVCHFTERNYYETQD